MYFPWLLSKTPLLFPSFFGHFPCRLAVMAGLAQALVVGRVDELAPVSPVGHDVVHHRGTGAEAPLGTLPAEGLPQELRRAQAVCPDGQAVPAMVLRRGPAGGLWPAYGPDSTPPGSGQRTPGVGMVGAALRPRAITSGQNKKRPSHDPNLSGFIGSGAGLSGRWLRRFDIHDGLLPASFALARQILGRSVRPDFQEFPLPAHWTDDPSILYDQFSRLPPILQPFHAHFIPFTQMIQVVSRQIKDARAIPFSVCAVAWSLSSPPSCSAVSTSNRDNPQIRYVPPGGPG